jgi:hypothetical protein
VVAGADQVGADPAVALHGGQGAPAAGDLRCDRVTTDGVPAAVVRVGHVEAGGGQPDLVGVNLREAAIASGAVSGEDFDRLADPATTTTTTPVAATSTTSQKPTRPSRWISEGGAFPRLGREPTAATTCGVSTPPRSEAVVGWRQAAAKAGRTPCRYGAGVTSARWSSAGDRRRPRAGEGEGHG